MVYLSQFTFFLLNELNNRLKRLYFCKMKKRIGILGCGWLGLGLSRSFIDEGHVVHGSRQSNKGADFLQENEISGFVVKINEDKIIGDLSTFLAKVNCLFLTLPPGIRKNPKRNFVAVIQQLVPHIQNSKVQQIVFTSSTSVFGPEQGLVTPQTTPKPVSESGKQLLEVEKILLSQPHFSTQIVRLGGLIDDDRHPVKQLAKLPIVLNPEAPINLIHKTDAIGLLRYLSEQADWHKIYHGVAPWHPTKKDFYLQAAKQLQISSPKFSSEKGVATKIVSDPYIELGSYRFMEPKLGLHL